MWSQDTARTCTSSFAKAPRSSRISHSSPVQMPGEGEREEDHHDRLVPAEAGQADVLAVLVLEGEVGCGRTDRRHAGFSHGAQCASRQRRAVLGATRRVPVQSGEALTLPEACRPAVSAASSMSLGSTVPTRPDLGRQQHDEAAVRQVGQGVDQRVGEVAVVLAPPQGDGVGHVAVVLVLELGADDVLDGDAKLVVDVMVVTDLLNHLAGGEPQLRHRAVRRGFRGRNHSVSSLKRDRAPAAPGLRRPYDCVVH